MSELRRILIANRGEIAERLNRTLHELGYETVACFTAEDGMPAWMEDADYPSYLGEGGLAATWMDPLRVLSMAMDAGCEAIHPGYCFLAEHVDFHAMCTNANVAVIGADARVLVQATDRMVLREVARRLGLPLIPASDALAAEEDGVAAAAQLGVPLFVKAVAGGALRRVAELSGVPAAVAAVRAEALAVSGDARVYLEREVAEMREIGTVIVGDRHGSVVHLGEADGTFGREFTTWIEEIGPDVMTGLHGKLGPAAVAVAKALGWVGVAKVRWIVGPDGGWYLSGFSGRLPVGYSLFEAVHGVDLVKAQIQCQLGEPLDWPQVDAHPGMHGLQVRLMHGDPVTGIRSEETLTALELPANAERGVEVGAVCSAQTEPLLAKLTVLAPTRAAALVKLQRILDGVRVEGVQSNLDAVRAAIGQAEFWRDASAGGAALPRVDEGPPTS